MKQLFVILFLANAVYANAQGLEAYKLYNPSGETVTYNQMLADMQKQDVLFLGETHNNPICHWIQLQLTADLVASENIVMGAEMFETDDQLVLDEYLDGTITLDHFKKEAKVWPNFDTDYAPLLEVAARNNIPFIATNLPRRYASLVARKGLLALDSLSPKALELLPPFPMIVTPNDRGYEEMRTMMGGHSHGMNIDQLISAQALKDYTMAHSIFQNLPKKGVFVHYNGTFHSQYHAGIVPYLLQLKPRLKVSVLAVVESEELEFTPEWEALGDYILVVASNMTKTH